MACLSSEPAASGAPDSSSADLDQATRVNGTISGRGVRDDDRKPLSSSSSIIHNLCVKLLRTRLEAFHVKHGPVERRSRRVYPQGVQAFYVVFHVKLGCLWISPVDNFGWR